MRFMIIVKATADSEAGVFPADYHEQLAKSAVLLDASGLQPSSKGWRVRYTGNQRKVIDGPFAETKELIAGYTLIQVRSTEVLLCLSCKSRAEVDGQVAKALAAGGTAPNAPQDHGFMYGHGFEDLDGHLWEVMYMDPNAVPPPA